MNINYVEISVEVYRWFNDREWMVTVTYPCGTRVVMNEIHFERRFGVPARGLP